MACVWVGFVGLLFRIACSGVWCELIAWVFSGFCDLVRRVRYWVVIAVVGTARLCCVLVFEVLRVSVVGFEFTCCVLIALISAASAAGGFCSVWLFCARGYCGCLRCVTALLVGCLVVWCL